MTPLAAAIAAIAFRNWMAGPDASPGEGQAKKRRELIEADWSDMAIFDIGGAVDALGRIAALEEMPPSPDMVSLAVDIITFRIEATARAEAWRAVGINPNRGRDLLTRNSNAVDWPIWNALRSGVLDVWPTKGE